MSGLDSESDWKGGTAVHWIRKSNLENFSGKNGNYIAMTINFENNEIALYQKGILIGSTKCSSDWLKSGGLTDNSIPFIIGMMIGGDTYGEYYSKMSLYSCRLYNKVLTDDEIKENYNKTVAYHNMLVNND